MLSIESFPASSDLWTSRYYMPSLKASSWVSSNVLIVSLSEQSSISILLLHLGISLSFFTGKLLEREICTPKPLYPLVPNSLSKINSKCLIMKPSGLSPFPSLPCLQLSALSAVLYSFRPSELPDFISAFGLCVVVAGGISSGFWLFSFLHSFPLEVHLVPSQQPSPSWKWLWEIHAHVFPEF